jgi:hypothetical protein
LLPEATRVFIERRGFLPLDFTWPNWAVWIVPIIVLYLAFTASPTGASFLPTPLLVMNDREPWTKSLNGFAPRRGEEEFIDVVLKVHHQSQFYWKYANQSLPTPSPVGSYTLKIAEDCCIC